MPTPTVTEGQIESPEQGAEETGASHLEAARDFLKSQTQGTNDETESGENPPEEKKTETPTATEKKSPLGNVVKLPGAKEETPATPESQAEDIAKGLVEPRADSKSHAGWQELKKKGNEALARAVAAEKRAAELEAKAKSSPAAADEATKARVTQLEQENKVFSERLKVLDLESHPEFEAQYVKPQNEAKQALSAIAKDDEVEVNVDELLSLRGKKFNTAVSEVLESLTPFARVKFQSALDRYIGAKLGAEQAVAQAGENLKKYRESGGARSRATFDSVAKNFGGAFLPAHVDEKADDATKAEANAYNSALAQVGKQAEAFAFGQADEKSVAEVAHKAALFDFTLTQALPRIDKIFQVELSTRDAKIAELEAKVKSLTAVNPKFSGGSGAPAPGESDEQPESHLEAARRFMAKGAQ